MYTYIHIYLKLQCVYVRTCVQLCMLGWRSEENLWQLFFSFHHVGPGHRIQVIRLESKSLYPLRHLSGHQIYFQMIIIELLGLERWLNVRTLTALAQDQSLFPLSMLGYQLQVQLQRNPSPLAFLDTCTCTHSKTHIIKSNKNEFLWAEEIFQQLRTLTSLKSLGFQHQDGALQLPITVVPGDVSPSSNFAGSCMHAHSVHTYT